MNRRLLILLVLLPWTAGLAQTQRTALVEWDWMVVGTMDIGGAFRPDDPGFKAPVPKTALPKTLKVAQKNNVAGVFEIVVTTDGTAEQARAQLVSSRQVRTIVKALLNRWRFEPASLDGKPVRVIVRVFLDETAAADESYRHGLTRL